MSILANADSLCSFNPIFPVPPPLHLIPSVYFFCLFYCFLAFFILKMPLPNPIILLSNYVPNLPFYSQLKLLGEVVFSLNSSLCSPLLYPELSTQMNGPSSRLPISLVKFHGLFSVFEFAVTFVIFAYFFLWVFMLLHCSSSTCHGFFSAFTIAHSLTLLAVKLSWDHITLFLHSSPNPFPYCTSLSPFSLLIPLLLFFMILLNSFSPYSLPSIASLPTRPFVTLLFLYRAKINSLPQWIWLYFPLYINFNALKI